MNNVTFIQVEQLDGSLIEHAIIDRGNGEYTSMPKSVYDEMIAKQDEASTL
jgi:predicted aspartyl protease